MERIRERIIKARLNANGDEAEAEQVLHERFGIDICSHRGEWIEVYDEESCRTVYFCKANDRIESQRPQGWVRMQIEGIAKAAVAARRWRKRASMSSKKRELQHSSDRSTGLFSEGGAFFQAKPQ